MTYEEQLNQSQGTEFHEQYLLQRQQWEAQNKEYYAFYGGISSTVWKKLENFTVIPTLGIIAYIFQSLNLPDNCTGFLNFTFIIIMVSAPVMGQCIAFLLVLRDWQKIRTYFELQFKTIEVIEKPKELATFLAKIALIERWFKFTLLAILLNFFVAGLIKFHKVDFLITASHFIFVVYLILLVRFILQYKCQKFDC